MENKLITLEGINHFQDKVQVRDGMCEDIVNIRFKDGSWRIASGGKLVFDMGTSCSMQFSQLYVHTNVYRHVIGVDENNNLCWIANIDGEGEFDISNHMNGDVYSPKYLNDDRGGKITISHDMYAANTGHLLTIIDCDNTGENTSMHYFVFKKATGLYRKVKTNIGGEQNDPDIYPFGSINFNYHSEVNDKYMEKKMYSSEELGNSVRIKLSVWQNDMITLFSKIKEKNKFSRPFLAIAAIELYDGSYVYASHPVLVYPRNRANTGVNYPIVSRPYNRGSMSWGETYSIVQESSTDSNYVAYTMPGAGAIFPECSSDVEVDKETVSGETKRLATYNSVRNLMNKHLCAVVDASRADKQYLKTNNLLKDCRIYSIPEESLPSYCNGSARCQVDNLDVYPGNKETWWTHEWNDLGLGSCVIGSDLTVSIQDSNFLSDNEDIFNALCIFVTPESDIYDLDEMAYKNTFGYQEEESKDFQINCTNYKSYKIYCEGGTHESILQSAFMYFPLRREWKDINYDLTHSNFYLLRRYDKQEVSELLDNPIVDLTSKKYSMLLSTLEEQKVLTVDSISRMSYIPKVQYYYNGRLHIANYVSQQYHGHPFSCFQFNNHSVKYSPNVTTYAMRNTEFDKDDLYSYYSSSGLRNIYTNDYLISKRAPVVIIRTEVETDDGTQVVVRYLTADQVDSFDPIKRNKVYEYYSALISFPDYRAKKMDIYIVQWSVTGSDNSYVVSCDSFQLSKMQYYNIALYLSEALSPMSSHNRTTSVLTAEGLAALVQETNTSNHQPNGLKVSSVYNPIYFPSKNTYLVGSSEIVAMCSNTVAVGTGQTGSAPLYVFCKDGVYSLFVDSSGEIVYTNARVLARDVCNNAKSVTPIDSGVVFTTDRGLMLASGSEVEEIGQSVEGEYQNADFHNISKVAYHYEKLAGFPDTTDLDVDFITYLKGAIINYNHNERELMVSNPDYEYSFIMDRENRWTRRNISADEYVNNFPTSYRLKDGILYRVDIDNNEKNGMYILSREIKLDTLDFKELSRFVARGLFETGQYTVYKPESVTKKYVEYNHKVRSRLPSFLKTIDQPKTYDEIFTYAFGAIGVVGSDTCTIAEDFGDIKAGSQVIAIDPNASVAKLTVAGSFDPVTHSIMEPGTISVVLSLAYSGSGTYYFSSAGESKLVLRIKIYNKYGVWLRDRILKSQYLSTTSGETLSASISLTESYNILNYETPDARYLIPSVEIECGGLEVKSANGYHGSGEKVMLNANVNIDNTKYLKREEKNTREIDHLEDAYIGIYVYGSYDGRNWGLLGHKEKKGTFNDIGCLVERSDCKFFKFVLAGTAKNTSRLDYFEVSGKDSNLSKKIR